jgi:hypothetical protein
MKSKQCHEDESDGQHIYWRVRIAIEILKGIAWAVWEEFQRGPRFPWL